MNGFMLVTAGLCVLLGCSLSCSWSPTTQARADKPAEGPIRDLRALPQDARRYIPPAQLDAPLLTARRQQELMASFRSRLFAPWHRDKPKTTREDVEADFTRFALGKYYDARKRLRGQAWHEALLSKAHLEDFPNRVLPGVTLRATSLRHLPTAAPCYQSAANAGEGAPFDKLQCTGVQVGAPLLLCHVAGPWAFVEGPQGAGWAPAADVAAVDARFQRMWDSPSHPLVAIVEEVSAISGNDRIAVPARIGTALPMASTDGEGKSMVLMPAIGEDGCIFAAKAPVRCRTAVMPWAMTPANFAAVANGMIGQPYGWGGQGGKRDCSALTHDLFVPFGLWLPRNSSEQARAGKVVSLKGLTGPQKERAILEKGRPWLTLLRSPGHIMVYIGKLDGRAIMLHSFWGVRTAGGAGEGRLVVDRCAITTLAPGAELPNLLPGGTYLDTMESMIFLAPETKN